ncbi:MAG: hypothetical protein KDI98_04975, partial [Hyphomicrobiaceae bacterium]|nr:hypothetical protein [Hyphomicrobiaceae bacterium]
LGGGFFALSPSPMIYDADVTGFWTYPPRTLRPVHPATGKKGPAGGFAVAPVATWNTDTRDFEAGVGASKVFANNNMLFFINARTDMPFSSEREVSVNFGVVFSVNGLAGSGLGKVGKVAGKAPTLPSMIAKGALTVGSEALDASKDYANVWYGPLWRGEATFDDNGNVVSLTVNGKTVNIDEMMAAGEALLGKEAESDSQFPVEGLNPEFYGP